MLEQFENIFQDVMRKVEYRPHNTEGQPDGNWNYIHQEHVANAFIKVRRLILEGASNANKSNT